MAAAAFSSKSAAISAGCGYGCSSAPHPLVALKYNKPNELSMKFHSHHHHHHQPPPPMIQSQRANSKSIMASSWSSSHVYNQSFEEEKQGGNSPLKSLWALLHPQKIILTVALRDEDGLIKNKFDHIMYNHDKNNNHKRALRESLDCFSNNADRIITSVSMVCYSELQAVGNAYKIEDHMECFSTKKVAEDDISCALVLLFVSTYDEISEANIHTLQDLEAFLQKLRAIKGDRLVVAMPTLSRKVYLNRILNSSKSYSHLSVPIRTNVAANIIEYGTQLMRKFVRIFMND